MYALLSELLTPQTSCTVAVRYCGNYHIRSSGKIIISPGTEETVGVLSKPACG